MPDGEHEEDRERDEHAEHDDEAQTRAGRFALAAHPRVAARSVVVVRAVDRFGVDGRIFGRCDAPRRLGHAGSLVPLPGSFDHTFLGSG